MVSHLLRFQRKIRIWTPLIMFGLLWKLSYGVRNLSSRILRAQFATFGVKFRVNWCPICPSRCQKVLRNAFRIQASQQNIDIMVVFDFSVRLIAYEITLYEGRRSIRQFILLDLILFNRHSLNFVNYPKTLYLKLIYVFHVSVSSDGDGTWAFFPPQLFLPLFP